MARQRPTGREPDWLTKTEEQTWRALATMVHKLRWALECQLERDSDLSFIEYYALARLSEEPDRRLRMSDLAAVTNASLSRLSHLTKRLEHCGYLRREADPTNGRYTLAILTAAGYQKLVGAAPGHVAAVRRLVIDDFSPRQLAQLERLADRITSRVDDSDWKQPLA